MVGSARQTTFRCKYYFNIGSIKSFEEKLEDAQEALGIDPYCYVPVTYLSEVIWCQALLEFFIIGLVLMIRRRVQRGFNDGGGLVREGSVTYLTLEKVSSQRCTSTQKTKSTIPHSLFCYFILFYI